ncbi:MAG TPA: ribbon-helix-helix protein, CopG family [Actinomycetales bacterium]|nr:ribbon-helix-helix protein, CopG family [Actinomycetales bacterium]
MRTTVSLEPDVVAAVERLRRQRGLGVSAAVNALARQGLVREAGQTQAYVLEPAELGLLVDVHNVSEALEQLDGLDAR